MTACTDCGATAVHACPWCLMRHRCEHDNTQCLTDPLTPRPAAATQPKATP
jgi:hypothetical protein